MADMLVKLYTLPDSAPLRSTLATEHIGIRRPLPQESPVLSTWVRRHFDESWAIGCEVALTQRPVTCLIAVEYEQRTHPPAHPYDLAAETLLGFACYDVASKGMFGALGVHPDYRRRGIGAALLITTLEAMVEAGYHYAVIGWAGDPEWYAKTVDAQPISDSEPGGFRGSLRIDRS
jgi:ribosomal protein S18 acetylase RimI-like enzyme